MKCRHVVRNAHMEQHASYTHARTHTHTHTQTHLYVGSEECSHTASHCGRAQEETLLWTQPPTFSCMLQARVQIQLWSLPIWNGMTATYQCTEPNRCALYISSNLLTSPPPHYYNYAHLACPVLSVYLVRIVLVTSSCYVALPVMDHIDGMIDDCND